MTIVGYARVSNIGQYLGVQIKKPREYGYEETFEEKRSGRSAARSDWITSPHNVTA